MSLHPGTQAHGHYIRGIAQLLVLTIGLPVVLFPLRPSHWSGGSAGTGSCG